MGQVANLPGNVRLRVAEEDDAKARRLRVTDQGKINGIRKRAGGRDQAEASLAEETAPRELEPIHPGEDDGREGSSLSIREDGIDTYA